MTISILPVGTSADYAAWRQVHMAVLPDERTPTIEELSARAGPRHRYVVAQLDGVRAGSGFVGKSDLAGQASLAPRVLPAFRRQGVGSAILRLLAQQATAMGFTIAGANAEDPGSARFAERHGLREVDRQIEQVRVIGDEPPPQVPPGVTILPVSTQPGLWLAAYEAVAAQAFQDMATVAVLEVTLQQWQQDWITDPDAMFVAVAEDGSPRRSSAPLCPGRSQRLHRGVHLDPARQRQHARLEHTSGLLLSRGVHQDAGGAALRPLIASVPALPGRRQGDKAATRTPNPDPAGSSPDADSCWASLQCR